MSLRKALGLGTSVLFVCAGLGCGESQTADPFDSGGSFSLDALSPFDAGVIDTGAGTDSAEPDAARPDGARPDGARPDSALPDTLQPDTLAPDAAAPDAAAPDSAEADAAEPDAATPDAAEPDAAEPDAAEADAAQADAAAPDAVAPDSGVDPCDRDGDGVQNSGCGGNDCDDDNGLRYPGNTEVCSFTDETCDDVNNEGLECWFYAVGADKLYTIDPFAPRAVILTDLVMPDPQNDISVLDVDLDTDGSIIAVTYEGVYTVNESNGAMSTFVSTTLPETPNGFSINPSGTIFISNAGFTEDSYVRSLDRISGALTPLVNLTPYSSSGDLVVLDDVIGVMSAPDPNDPVDGVDQLLAVDVSDGSLANMGAIGYADVWGLSFSFGYLFGLTGEGEVLWINPGTGAGMFLFQVVDAASDPVPFFGAADATPF